MKDRFSANANHYAQFRPGYPPELFDFIYHHIHRFDTAWDCGTGNGQAARELSLKFTKVFATDISAQQLEHAYQAENIFYSISSEPSLFDDHSVDLITLWSLQELRGYLSTWSAVQKYISIKGQDPVKNLIAEVEIYWRNEKQLVNFPLFLKLGSSGAP